jgi:hypothetical protein
MDLKKQHRAAIRLLKRLGLTTIRLERDNGSYRYRAWGMPKYRGNRSAAAKSGKVKA